MAKSNNGLHLPGSFNSFPKGPKPAHYAPHTQRDIGRPSPQGAPSQRTIETRTAEKSPRHNISPYVPADRMPQHKISEPNLRERTPKHSPTLKTKDELRVNNTASRKLEPNDKTMRYDNAAIDDPFGNYYFTLELNGAEVAHFREATGFKSSSDVFTVQEGGMNGATRVLPGQGKWNSVTLKRAMNATTEFITWRDKYVSDDLGGWKTDSGAIILRANDGTEIRRISIFNPWPVSWEGPQLNSGGSDLAVETLEIAYDHVELDGTNPTPPPNEEPPPPEPPDELVCGPVQFPFDSAQLTPAAKASLDQISEQIQDNDVKEIWCEAHSCDLYGQPSEGAGDAYNNDLSQRRAQSCADYLAEQNPGVTTHANGYGWHHPLAPNDRESNRSRNRRCNFFTSPRGGDRPGEIPYVRYNNRRY